MTLAVAWIRRIRDCEELIVASDSRLSGGRTIDGCAKIILLPRSDAFLCCAGDTDITYFLANQVASAVNVYERSADRSLDIRDLRGHVLKILTKAMEGIETPIDSLAYPDRFTQLLFGGYSWQGKTFEIWRLSYSKPEGSFRYYPAPGWCGGRARVVFAGDWQHIARRRLINLLRERHSVTPQSDVDFHFSWEPFEVLRDCLRETEGDSKASIGGPPQIAKVYQHLNTRPIGVFWPNKESGQVAVAGRFLLEYEKVGCWLLDPDTLRTSHLYYSLDEEG
jgi:hypothetical protein